jgi:putative ATPase
LALAQAAVYLAVAPKSNAMYTAFGSARQTIADQGSLEVPLHLRNATTNLSKELGYGEEYRYAHDEDDAFAAGEKYLPEEIQKDQFYNPKQSGLEIRIKEKMDNFRHLNQQAKNKRYE